MLSLLSRTEIEKNLAQLTGWQLDGNAFKKEWVFKDFSEAMRFLNKVADIAEKHNHHPEIFNVYNRVSLRLSTHDSGGLTELDLTVAKDIDLIK